MAVSKTISRAELLHERVDRHQGPRVEVVVVQHAGDAQTLPAVAHHLLGELLVARPLVEPGADRVDGQHDARPFPGRVVVDTVA